MLPAPLLQSHWMSIRCRELTQCPRPDLRETAVKLQNEWQIEDPQQLDFAPHVKHHALVTVLQKGLLYREAEKVSANDLPRR
jgi:hypothetical protein